MKIGLLIGRLGQGGAERQLINLAIGLARRGHQVEVLSYRGSSPLDVTLTAHDVVVHSTPARGRLGHIALARRWFKDFAPDIAHGFMKRASCVAVLARLPLGNCKVVVSDYSTATYGRNKPSLWGSLCLFGLADHVVTETQMNRHSLERLAPWLRGRVSVVRNGLDLGRFQPSANSLPVAPLRLCAVGSVYAVKNPERVVEAIALLQCRRGRQFRLDWYGRYGLEGDGTPSLEYTRSLALVERLGVSDLITFHGETADIERVFSCAHALIHASLQEGFPNAVAEAMASGLPLLVSRVSDLPLVVEQGQNGFVFDETDPVSIADAMERMLDSSEEERRQMGERSRRLACEWFGEQRFIDDYLNLYTKMTGVPHVC